MNGTLCKWDGSPPVIVHADLASVSPLQKQVRDMEFAFNQKIYIKIINES
jgi:hypothetical protein